MFFKNIDDRLQKIGEHGGKLRRRYIFYRTDTNTQTTIIYCRRNLW